MSWERMRLLVGVTVALLPGGLLVLLGWLLVRAVVRARARALAQQPDSGPRPALWRTLADLDFQEVVREARAAF